MNLDPNIDLETISDMCSNFTGADVKSVVCDALVKAFHRAHSSLNLEKSLEFDRFKSENEKTVSQEELRSSIRINSNDLISSINTIKQTININERIRLKNM
jgi:SpoVK/Ycf46/Vps4 family AAA+-type ATPase